MTRRIQLHERVRTRVKLRVLEGHLLLTCLVVRAIKCLTCQLLGVCLSTLLLLHVEAAVGLLRRLISGVLRTEVPFDRSFRGLNSVGIFLQVKPDSTIFIRLAIAEQVLLLEEISQLRLSILFSLLLHAAPSGVLWADYGCSGVRDNSTGWIDGPPVSRLQPLEDLIVVLFHQVDGSHGAHRRHWSCSTQSLLTTSEHLEIAEAWRDNCRIVHIKKRRSFPGL